MSDFTNPISVLVADATIRTRPEGDRGMLLHEALARSRHTRR